MVNRIHRDTARENLNLTDKENSPVTDYPYRPSAVRRSKFNDLSGIDEVIAHLASAHENRRARQVTEWERMPRHYVH